jgi:ABC-type bacteriocin/lantibiotic exporter with double-glycine peptidase domain
MPTTWLNVPLLPQSDRADCLPACIEMVLAFLGQPVERAWLRQVMESSDLGTPGFKVLNLRHHGYEVTYAAATDERVLIQALADGIPPIVLLHTTSLPHWECETAHAVVVIAAEADVVVLNDPAFPSAPQTVPRNVFMLAWSDLDYLYALICPAQA